MLKTSNDLLEWLGLKVGDRIRINDNPTIYIVEKNECDYPFVRNKDEKIRYEVTYLLNRKVEILPSPEMVGNLKCKGECSTCPIRAIWCSNSKGKVGKTLYEILENWKNTHSVFFDRNIYEVLLKRLNKEVSDEEET